MKVKKQGWINIDFDIESREPTTSPIYPTRDEACLSRYRYDGEDKIWTYLDTIQIEWEEEV